VPDFPLQRQPPPYGELKATAMTMVRYSALVLGILLTSNTWAQVPSVERGRALYENHCTVCHTSQVHARVNRIPVSRAEVREIVESWQTQQKLAWGTQEVEDVVEFLNRSRYQFP
jgi:mono/diheme cytochrome c family protein